MSDALSYLRRGLARSFAVGVREPQGWNDPAGMARARAQVQREHGGAGIPADSRTIMSAITDFRRTGAVVGIRDLKYVCLGIGMLDDRGRCVLADTKLRDQVLGFVAREPEMRRRLRCFQALLSGYWTFPLDQTSTPREAIEGWRELRLWLRSEYENILNSKELKPLWFGGLTRHHELLSDQPCETLGTALLRGDSSPLNDAIECLAIPKDSWVMGEAIFAQIKAATQWGDKSFKDALLKLMPILMGKAGVETGKTLRIRGIAQLVSRYARCKDRSEHIALRDAAIAAVGNPWVRRANWDAWVIDEKGKPDNQAREMVNGWLKRRLISDFFVLLSFDGTGDPRRLDYWLRFEPLIDDMWFALGPDAWHRSASDFQEFRARAVGRLLDLQDSTSDNNAFVMRIGEYLAVEFGATGNAFFLFKWDSLGQPLIEALTSGRAKAGVSRDWLKAQNHEERLIHRDSSAETWEQKFDQRICPLLGHPGDAPRRARATRERATARAQILRHPTPAEWDSFVRNNRLTISDFRTSKGALWVVAQDLPRDVAEQLEKWGFRRREHRGWYKE